ncbi:trichohyalin-like isoform X3 [Varroa destructor]|uniref:Uncharacterized protein n=1 Tax=Varroa destructor TaxID=109461 RepID=A0A7M7K369_VARDE|nr:trichohyalin-like isoform X3 [Varroa destructor]
MNDYCVNWKILNRGPIFFTTGQRGYHNSGFAEMLRQQYLNDPDFKYEDYPYIFKADQYVAPSYIPDPILFGLDTPPWMPCEDDLFPARRSKEILEQMDAACDSHKKAGTQSTLKDQCQQGSGSTPNIQEEKKDQEKDVYNESNTEKRSTVENAITVKRIVRSEVDKTPQESDQLTGIADHREQEMDDDLQEINRKVNEIDREIERLEMEVRDREVLRRRESEDKETLSPEIKEKLHVEGDRFEVIRKEQEVMRSEEHLTPLSVEDVSKMKAEEIRRKQEEHHKKENEKLRQRESRDKKGKMHQVEGNNAAERTCRYSVGNGRLPRTSERKKDIDKRHKNLEAPDGGQTEQEKGNILIKSKSSCETENEHVKKSVSNDEQCREIQENYTSGDDKRGGGDRNTRKEYPIQTNLSNDTSMMLASRPESCSLTYVTDQSEFHRTTAELEEFREPGWHSVDPKDHSSQFKGKQDSPSEANDNDSQAYRSVEYSQQNTANPEDQTVYREVPKSGQHTPRHNVLQPGPGILKNKGVSGISDTRRSSFVSRGADSTIVELDRPQDDPSSTPLVPVSELYNKNSQAQTDKATEDTVECKDDTQEGSENKESLMIEEDQNDIGRKAQYIEKEIERRRGMMQRKTQDGSVCNEDEARECGDPDAKIKAHIPCQHQKGFWQQTWEENHLDKNLRAESKRIKESLMAQMSEEQHNMGRNDQKQQSNKGGGQLGGLDHTQRKTSNIRQGGLSHKEESQKKASDQETERDAGDDTKCEEHSPQLAPLNTHLSRGSYPLPARRNDPIEHEVVPMVLSPRTLRTRRIAEAEKEMQLSEIANNLRDDLHREIIQRQIDHHGDNVTEFVNHYSCYLPSMRNPNVDVRRFQRDVHTPNLEELNIKKTSQVLISGIHGAPESGCSDSSPPPRCNISPLNLISPPGQYTLYHIMEGNTQDYLHQKLSAEQPSEKDRADKGCAANTESQKRLATSINEERLPDSPNVSHKGRRDSAPNHFDEEKVNEKNNAGRKNSVVRGASPESLSSRDTEEVNLRFRVKESEASSRSETPSSSIELICSKDDGKDARSEYALLMGKKIDESPKPTAIPLPPPSRRPSLRSSFKEIEDTSGETCTFTPMAVDLDFKVDGENLNTAVSDKSTYSSLGDTTNGCASGNHKQAFSSSPVAYSSKCTAASHVRKLITKNVKHHVPNIVSKRVLGLDLYSGDAPRPENSDNDEDSFFG